MNTLKTLFTIVSLVALASCGGGGGGSNPNTASVNNTTITSAPTIVDTGSVSAQFVAGPNATYDVAALGGVSGDRAQPVIQKANGAVTSFGGYSLTGTPTAVLDISGDESYAIGRWALGTLNDPSSNTPIMLSGYQFLHYVVRNSLTTMPNAQTTTCDSGKFTLPTYSYNSPPPPSSVSSSVNGSASLVLTGSVANVTVSIATVNGDQNGYINGSVAITRPGSSYSTGDLLSGGEGVSIHLADGGNGSYLVIANYRLALPKGSMMRGISVFRCKQRP
jgi:hypothetical protein